VVKVGEEIEIVGLSPTQKTTCTGVEMFRKLLDQGQAGDNVGILLRGTKREEVQRGQVLCKPGSVKPHTHFTAEIYVLSKDEGGRHTPFFNNYRPQFYFRTTDVTGAIELPKDKEMVMPGDNVTITVKLIAPIAMEEGLRFAIREGGKTVGAGVVAKIMASCQDHGIKFSGSGIIAGSPKKSFPEGYSSIGRASVSKTEGCRFDSYCPCHLSGTRKVQARPGVKTDGLQRLKDAQILRKSARTMATSQVETVSTGADKAKVGAAIALVIASLVASTCWQAGPAGPVGRADRRPGRRRVPCS
jgi:hypothetical protein